MYRLILWGSSEQFCMEDKKSVKLLTNFFEENSTPYILELTAYPHTRLEPSYFGWTWEMFPMWRFK